MKDCLGSCATSPIKIVATATSKDLVWNGIEMAWKPDMNQEMKKDIQTQ